MLQPWLHHIEMSILCVYYIHVQSCISSAHNKPCGLGCSTDVVRVGREEGSGSGKLPAGKGRHFTYTRCTCTCR